MEIIFNPIGMVHSPFQEKKDIKKSRNIDPKGFEAIQGELEIFGEFADGLHDLDGFSHIILIFFFHKSMERKLYAYPPFDKKRRGIFSTRSPNRPNPIGFTVLRLLNRDKNKLRVQGLDMIEGTPILDIKPYTPRDQKPEARFGWLQKWLG
ncbi:MAG: tRNA (N6-threonylcarbamoyladenosine(37)-N6)-methyltransferase TrmO [Candidatus Aminicenantes bacterium]|nr:MAG: tRNA (N6-threonylcarbamoyladenosine(37)-N6)-methyltransferase TrmO [Candidatus Aminicenantes bacterium]